MLSGTHLMTSFRLHWLHLLWKEDHEWSCACGRSHHVWPESWDYRNHHQETDTFNPCLMNNNVQNKASSWFVQTPWLRLKWCLSVAMRQVFTAAHTGSRHGQGHGCMINHVSAVLLEAVSDSALNSNLHCLQVWGGAGVWTAAPLYITGIGWN